MKKNINFYYKTLFILISASMVIFATPIRIMPLGDSITKGYPTSSGYRGYLWSKLHNADYSIDFVGSQNNGSGFDSDHEGYGGIKTFQLAPLVYNLLIQNTPDIVLLHIGTNDTSPTQGTHSSSISGLRNILDEIDRYEQNSGENVHVVLATIIYRTIYDSLVDTYNNRLRNLANSRILQGDDITMVEMNDLANLSAASHYSDYTHPNYLGYSRMANVWFNTLVNVSFAPLYIPDTPSEVSITDITTTSASLTWVDNASNEDGFRLENNGVLLVDTDADTTQYIFENLDSNTAYNFTLHAFNAIGDSEKINISFTTKPDYSWLVSIYHIILN